jgi:hypothetical protein
MRPAELANVCVACGATDRVLVAVPGAMLSQVRVCPRCLVRYGAERLRAVADAALARVEGPAARCGHCGAPVVLTAEGHRPYMCAACIEEWRRIGR